MRSTFEKYQAHQQEEQWVSSNMDIFVLRDKNKLVSGIMMSTTRTPLFSVGSCMPSILGTTRCFVYLVPSKSYGYEHPEHSGKDETSTSGDDR
jgi:hypothetical protein